MGEGIREREREGQMRMVTTMMMKPIPRYLFSSSLFLYM